jgi:xylan 1,4-beta-xylosidase
MGGPTVRLGERVAVLALVLSHCTSDLYVGARPGEETDQHETGADTATLADPDTGAAPPDGGSGVPDDTSGRDTETESSGPCSDEAAVDPGALTADQPLPESLRPLSGFEDITMYDPFITLGPDGNYYLTGSTVSNVLEDYDGIELWRSTDLVQWNYLGFIWTFEEDAEEGSWYAEHYPYVFGGETYIIRVPWAPEIHYINGNWWIPFATLGGATGILKSTTGEPEGPYENAITQGGGFIARRHINPSLFQDDDGTVYYIEDNALIAPMLEDLSGLAEPLTGMEVTGGGNDGAALFKAFGRYYLSLSKYHDEAEDLYVHVVQVSGDIYGPYTDPHEVISNLPGDLTFFRDKDCAWWMTLFGTADTAFEGRPAIVPVEFDVNHLVRLDLDRL